MYGGPEYLICATNIFLGIPLFLVQVLLAYNEAAFEDILYQLNYVSSYSLQNFVWLSHLFYYILVVLC
jgi:hypothetical protein